ncbi:MAG: site-specific DNA-methyltransferase [Treponema sp.]|nr:site-specific DNA-methyltransferase [Treponema sp.]
MKYGSQCQTRTANSHLDPFVGSGTTLRVALQSGHDAIGIDLSPEFYNYILSQL